MCRMSAENAGILLDHFVEGKTILAIGKNLFITKRQAQRRVNEAVIEFQNLLNEHET